MNHDRPTSTLCFHCEEPVPAGFSAPVLQEGVSHLCCCYGCQAVAQAIIDGDGSAYYAQREHINKPPDHWQKHEFTAYAREAPVFVDGDFLTTDLVLRQMSCAACAWLINKHLSSLSSQLDFHIDLPYQRIYIRWPKAWDTGLVDILSCLIRIGYKAEVFSPEERLHFDRGQEKEVWVRWAWAALSMMQVMMFSVPIYLSAPGEIEEEFIGLMHGSSLLLTLPVLLYSAIPFYRGAWQEWCSGHPGMNLPITLGILATFLGSVFGLWTHQTNSIYFDAIGMFVFFMLSARLIERYASLKAYRASLANEHLLPHVGYHAVHYPLMDTQPIQHSHIKAGMVLLCPPGGRIPCDGEVLVGESLCDESLISGEASPIVKKTHDTVWAGSLNQTANLWVKANVDAHACRIRRWQALIRTGTRHQQEQSSFTEQVSRYFSYGLLFCAGCCVFVLVVMATTTRIGMVEYCCCVGCFLSLCPCFGHANSPIGKSVCPIQNGLSGLSFGILGSVWSDHRRDFR